MADMQPIKPPVFTKQEQATYDRCERFLWAVRCHLHFLTGRAEERLSFDVQPELASRLGYATRRGSMPVERFMKHYFLIAKDVGDLTAVLCSALEVAQLKTSPGLGSLLNPLTWRMRRRVRATSDFRVDNGRLNVADEKVFERDPANLLRIFAHAEHAQTFLHPDAIRLIRRSVPTLGPRLRMSDDANRIFLELLTSKRGSPEAALRRMNEAGVLGRFMPEFGKVVSMMQFNMYHHFTVDEHLVRTVGQLYEIEQGALAKELPLSTRIFSSIQGRRALFVAGFLHDIGKGRPEDHSILGARIARTICPRLGLTDAETDTIVWLIEQHLFMSNTALSRDLADPKTIRDFADVVQTPERLKLLLLLTVADIRAVGPGTWNGWKGQLLRTLYAETELQLTGGHTMSSHKARVGAAQDELRTALAAWPKDDVEAFIDRHYPDYWLKSDVRRQMDHAELMRRAAKTGKSLATECRTDEFTAITELTVLAPNHPRLLSLFAGACAHAGANIVGANISTTRDGLALDTFQLQRENMEADERRRADRIADTIGRLLEGKARIGQLMAKRRPVEKRVAAFAVTPEVMIDNALSDRLTVIQVSGRDRTGLLYELTSKLSDLNLDIASAHIATFGEKAVDVFYVTDLTGKKIMGEARQRLIIDGLASVLASHGGLDALPEPAAAPVQA
ncbi:MAG TPA: [protein-PII] uridylyltransferase [Hyphomicrobiaceae bacterium]|nr:[protein-PII] uridylyltransferase [Hyphomicrobiaceae bacterium]